MIHKRYCTAEKCVWLLDGGICPWTNCPTGEYAEFTGAIGEYKEFLRRGKILEPGSEPEPEPVTDEAAAPPPEIRIIPGGKRSLRVIATDDEGAQYSYQSISAAARDIGRPICSVRYAITAGGVYAGRYWRRADDDQ